LRNTRENDYLQTPFIVVGRLLLTTILFLSSSCKNLGFRSLVDFTFFTKLFLDLNSLRSSTDSRGDPRGPRDILLLVPASESLIVFLTHVLSCCFLVLKLGRGLKFWISYRKILRKGKDSRRN